MGGHQLHLRVLAHLHSEHGRLGNHLVKRGDRVRDVGVLAERAFLHYSGEIGVVLRQKVVKQNIVTIKSDIGTIKLTI